ncbi:MAG: glycosyltransferase family 39 protein [Deltaproteobacteria bacterium]|nr:glycosyltransferase family 39 protein [Deltaproteobacteria bacterium]
MRKPIIWVNNLLAWGCSRRVNLQRIFFYAILIIGAAYRLDRINKPLIDHHSWRQCDTAAIAANFLEEDANIMHPRIDWRGTTNGEVEWNFPLFPYLVSLAYRVFGRHDFLGRLLSVFFSLGALSLLYLFARRIIGTSAALVSAFFFAVNPLAIYFGRTFMPEALLVFCAIGFLLAIDQWAEHQRRKDLLLAIVAMTCAGLVKITFGILILPAIFLVTRRRGLKGLLDYRLWIGSSIILGAVVAWYWYAHQLGAATGLTFAPIWNFGTDKWGNFAILTNVAFWRTIYERFYDFVTPSGFLFIAGAGLILTVKNTNYRWLSAFIIGGVIHLLLIAAGHQAHTYYQIVFIPMVALLIGLFVQIYVNHFYQLPNNLRVAGVFILVVLSTWGLYTGQKSLRRMHANRGDYVAAGQNIAAITSPQERIISVSSCCMPEALYYSRRKGWHANVVADPKEWVIARRNEQARAAVLLTSYSTSVDEFICSNNLAKYLTENFPNTSRGKNYLVLDLHPEPQQSKTNKVSCLPQ